MEEDDRDIGHLRASKTQEGDTSNIDFDKDFIRQRYDSFISSNSKS